MKQKISYTEFILDFLAIAFVFLLPHFGLLPVPFYYIIPVLLFIWLYLKRTKENFTNIGFSFKKFEIKSVAIGAIAAVILFLFIQHIFFPLFNKIGYLKPANLNDFKNIKGHLFNYIFILLAGFIVGGFYEEIAFHGFIFTRFNKIIPGKSALTVSFVITNLLFALYHIQQGTSGIINAFIAGCAYHALMLKFNRNLWYAIFFHAFFDAIGLTYIYLGYW